MVRLSWSSLSDGRWYEYVMRFVLGGFATVFTGLIGAKWGPAIGGLFLAFPAMLCASATLVEAHEKRRKKEFGLEGSKRGKDAAAVDAAGAALGSVALVAFGATVLVMSAWAPWTSLGTAALIWIATAIGSWWAYVRLQRQRGEPPVHHDR